MKKKLVLLLAIMMCISLCACGGSETSSGNNAGENGDSSLSKTEQEIEITLDNWQDYFEFKEVILPYNTYNAFDELESENITVDYCFALKDKYEIDIEKSKEAIEITGYYEEWSINADMNALSVTYIEAVGKKHDFNRTAEFKQLFRENIFRDKEQLEGTVYYGVQVSSLGEPNITWFNEETQIRTARRCVIDEVNRIQGTIYVKEK